MSEGEYTGAKLWSLMHDMNDAMDRLKDHIGQMESGTALPTGRDAQKALIASHLKVIQKLTEDYSAAVDELLAKYQP